MFPNPKLNISGITIYQTVRWLRPLGYQFRVIYPVPRSPFPFNLIGRWKAACNEYPDYNEIDGVPVEFPRFTYTYRLIPGSYSGTALWMTTNNKLIRIVRKFNPDLLWAQPTPSNGWAAMKLSQKFSIPYVIGVHGADINEYIHLPGAKKRMAKVYRNAVKVIAVSQRLKRGVMKIEPNADCDVIYLGIDPLLLEDAEAAAKQRLAQKRSNDDFIVVSVSNLIETKGLEYNLHALRTLVQKFPRLRYRIIGDGPFKERLKKMIEDFDLTNHVIFVGQLEYNNAMREIACADIFSMPSYKEGFGMVYIEGMALGVPVIGCQGQGIADVIEDGVNGFLVEPQNSDDLTKVWKQLLTDSKLRTKIGNTGRKTVQQSYLWQSTAEKFDEVFRSIISTS